MSKQKPKKLNTLPKHLRHININAAGIDIGSRSHFVAVPNDRDEISVREFQTFTPDLQGMANWLQRCGIETIAMESTGVYWIPAYEILEEKGFEVLLVNARHVKNVAGRKSDVLDCQWLQELHTYGLLSGAFRPEQEICQLRGYVRQRSNLVKQSVTHVQHMQKALDQMNVRLHNVISDITGTTGLKILRAIIHGERDPQKLAYYRDRRCKSSQAIIEKSLIGNYRPEHVFALKQALELYDFYRTKIEECDLEIEGLLQELVTDVEKNYTKVKKQDKRGAPKFDVEKYLYHLTGINLLEIDGVSALSGLKIVSEIGCNMEKWPTEKHFTSWLGLSPGTKISGGKVLSSKTKVSANRTASILRLCANTLYNSQSAIGAFLRRQKARLGSPKAITATARKLAIIIYRMIKYKMPYKDAGQEYYEQRYRDRIIKNLKRKAKLFGLDLIEMQQTIT